MNPKVLGKTKTKTKNLGASEYLKTDNRPIIYSFIWNLPNSELHSLLYNIYTLRITHYMRGKKLISYESTRPLLSPAYK